MYKNIEEEIQAGKRDTLKVVVVQFLLIIFVATIAYFAGCTDNVERFNTFYKDVDSTWVTKDAYKELGNLLKDYEIYSETDDIYFIRQKDTK